MKKQRICPKCKKTIDKGNILCFRGYILNEFKTQDLRGRDNGKQ